MENLRVSSYMIPVKLDSENGKYMLIHGYTGAADIVSETLLEEIKNISSTNNLPTDMLQKLFKRGYITTKSPEEEYIYVARIAKALHKESDILATSFTWIVSYKCNFRCPYCFEGRDKKDGSQNLAFTKEQVDIAYEAQDMIQPHQKLRTNMITLYGGEPLLAENKEIVKYIIHEGIKRGYTFTAVTNGYEIDQFENVLGENGIYRLQITIDGPKEIHNKRRIHHRDSNTFDKIIKNIKLALDKGVRVVIRMNSDGQNVDQCNELKRYFEEKSFFEYPYFYFYIARLRDYYDISSEEKQNLNFISPKSFIAKQKQNKIDPFTLDTGFYKDVYDALLNKRSIRFRPVACKAQSNKFIFDPFGNIYPCWETIGKKEHIIGVYSRTGVTWDTNVCNKWNSTDVIKTKPCNTCKYVLFCAGGCPYHRMLQKNDQHCFLFREIFKLAINKAYAEIYHN